MLTRKLMPRFNRNKIDSKRRGSQFMNGVYDRFHALKIRLEHGRRKPIRWWEKSYVQLKKWRTRNDG